MTFIHFPSACLSYSPRRRRARLSPGRFRTHLQEIESLRQERTGTKQKVCIYLFLSFCDHLVDTLTVETHTTELKRPQIGCERCQEKNMGAPQVISPSQSKTTRIGSSLLLRFVSQSKYVDKPKAPSNQTSGSAQPIVLSPAIRSTRFPGLELHTASLSVPSPSLQLPTLAIDPDADTKKMTCQ